MSVGIGVDVEVGVNVLVKAEVDVMVGVSVDECGCWSRGCRVPRDNDLNIEGLSEDGPGFICQPPVAGVSPRGFGGSQDD